MEMRTTDKHQEDTIDGNNKTNKKSRVHAQGKMTEQVECLKYLGSKF